MKRAGPLRRRRPLVARRRADTTELAAYKARHRGVYCQRCGARPGCHAHHRRRRSQGGTDDHANLAWLCPPCHRWVHNNVADAIDAGYLIPAGGPHGNPTGESRT